ncbi:MAG TPA: hypothetical protein VNU44_15615 [Bryobacteraceae bacterium]|jgi:photosystem II stability/assembly factor-like uncharacterized protein|nr:hypothetical protein [Bryobacteraceae bacterium]
MQTRRTLLPLALASLACAILTGCSKDREGDAAQALRISRERVRVLHRNSGRPLTALAKESETRLRGLIMETRHPDMARYREAFWAMLHRDERGVIPPGGLQEGLRQKAALAQRLSRSRFVTAGIPVRSSAAVPRTGGLNPDHSGWTELGPASVGGRTRAIAIDPRNPGQIWAGSVGGGVWHSTDGGATFAPANDLLANLVISTLVINPSDPNNVYAGSGEGFLNSDALRGAGIFQTTDGVNWTQLASTATGDFQYVNRLAMSADGATLTAATGTGILISTDPGRGVWTKGLSGNIADIVFHPTDSSRAVAAGLDTGQTYYTEDRGLTWHTASHAGAWIHVWENGSTSPGRVELTYAKANPSIVYASVDNNSGEIWQSQDGGKSYAKRDGIGPDGGAANYLAGQGWYGNSIWAGDPANANLVIVGGIDLWRSTDGGNNLIDISNWENDDSVHSDHHAIVSHPGYNGTTNRTVFFGNDGGLYLASDVTTVGSDPDRAQGWTRMNHNYDVTQFYGIAIGPDETLVAGAQDNGTLLLGNGAGPSTWAEMFGGDGGFCAADSTDANYLYGEYVQGNITRRSQSGQPADYISGQYWDSQNRVWAWKGAPYEITDAHQGKANFIAPFALDPNNPNRILVGGASLWLTSDAKTPNDVNKGPQWRTVKNPVPAPPDNPTVGYISAVAIAPSDSTQVWVGHNNGAVYFSSNGLDATPQWTQIDGGTLPARMVTHITVSRQNPATVYITFAGYSSGNIWKTTDRGAHWTSVSATLPSVPVYSLTNHPKNSNFIYAGTDIGIFASEDGGMHWSPGNEGPTNSAVFDMTWAGNVLYAATHGRGAFKIDLSQVPPGA